MLGPILVFGSSGLKPKKMPPMPIEIMAKQTCLRALLDYYPCLATTKQATDKKNCLKLFLSEHSAHSLGS